MRTLIALTGSLAALLAGSGAGAQDAWFKEPPAPGPWIGLGDGEPAAGQSFDVGRPLVGTYLFYWYDEYSGAHVTYGDGGDACTTHPVSWWDYSFNSTRWWLEQLQNITAAGINVAAPVYWGYPGDYGGWSFAGLPHLVRACDYLQGLGREYPKIALFYDTSTLQHNSAGRHIDLSTPDGKAWFYCSIRDFFSLIPPRHRAAMDGRPIVLLYSPHFAAQQDPALFPYVRERFRADFGADPYIIKQTSWQGEADSTCDWGGALGLRLGGCAALGPGYDHTAVRGRQPLIVEREGGEFYRRSWERLLALSEARRPSLVMVETWNEFHEGTDVAESLEYGRQYIELTREYADRFRAGERIRPTGPFADARAVEAVLGAEDAGAGVRIVAPADGAFARVERAGRACVESTPTEHGGRYLYFDLDPSFAFEIDPQPVRITVEYLDAGCEALQLEYDSLDPQGSVREGAFKGGNRVEIAGTGEWLSAQFEVGDARFADRANGADFRFAVLGAGELALAKIRVEKLAAD